MSDPTKPPAAPESTPAVAWLIRQRGFPVSVQWIEAEADQFMRLNFHCTKEPLYDRPAAPESPPAQESGEPLGFLTYSQMPNNGRTLSFARISAESVPLYSHPALETPTPEGDDYRAGPSGPEEGVRTEPLSSPSGTAETPSREAQAPLGWRLVPVEATEAIQQVICNAIMGDMDNSKGGWWGTSDQMELVRDFYRSILTAAALAAAPSPPSQPEAASAGVREDAAYKRAIADAVRVIRSGIITNERTVDWVAENVSALSQTTGQSTQDSVSPSKEKGQAG